MEEKDLKDGCGCGCGCDSKEETTDCCTEKEGGCGCDDNCSDEENGCGCEDHHHGLTVTLEDENGVEIQCEVIEGFEYKENEYALVQNPSDESVYLFKVVGEGEEGQLVVPEDEEFNEVIAYYEALLGSDE